MSMVKAIPITDNADIKNIIKLLLGAGMKQEQQDVESLVQHIGFMETQFGKVLEELHDVKSQLKTIEDKSVRATVGRIVDSAEIKVNEVKIQFVIVKDNVVKTFSKAAKTVKEKGISAFKKVVDFLRVHTALSKLKNKLDQAVGSLCRGVSRIESLRIEIHAAKTHAANAGRVISGKNAEVIAAPKSDRGILAGIQKLLTKTAALLSGLSKVTDSAIKKVERLGQQNEKTSVHVELVKHTSRAGGKSTIEKSAREAR